MYAHYIPRSTRLELLTQTHCPFESSALSSTSSPKRLSLLEICYELCFGTEHKTPQEISIFPLWPHYLTVPIIIFTLWSHKVYLTRLIQRCLIHFKIPKVHLKNKNLFYSKDIKNVLHPPEILWSQIIMLFSETVPCTSSLSASKGKITILPSNNWNQWWTESN